MRIDTAVQTSLSLAGPPAVASFAALVSVRRALRRPGGFGPSRGVRCGTGGLARAALEDPSQPSSGPTPSSSSSTPSSQQQLGEVQRLPLDYYKLLQVPPVASRDSITTSFDRLLSQPPTLGYSQATLLARGTTLKGILHTLTDVAARKAYDERLRVGDVNEDVPDEFVPGMLALLQESGESQTVVAAGEHWLSMHRRDPGAKDVALTTALAHSTVANSTLERSGDVLAAVRMLEVASQLLCSHRAGAEALQRQMAEKIEELQPAVACELVALPLERFQERENGLVLAKSLLSGSNGASAARAAGMCKQAFLERLGKSLTSAEHIALYEATGSAFAETSSELYDVALAYIDSATTSQKPARLVRALQALQAAASAVPRDVDVAEQGLKQAAERQVQEEGSRRAVAACVCHLLLGETDQAHSTLGLGLGGIEVSIKCERSVLTFIKSHSPTREDLLPGLCFLAQRWVSDVAQSSYRGSAPSGFTLEAWFQNSRVQRYLELRAKGVLPDGAEGSPLRIAAATMAAMARPLISGLGAVLAPLGLLADGPGSGHENGGERHSRGADVAAVVNAVAGQGAAAVPCVTQVASSTDMRNVDFRQARKERPLPQRPTTQPQPPPQSPAIKPVSRVDPEAADAAVIKRAALERAKARAATGVASASRDEDEALVQQALTDLKPLPGIEERMWDSYQPRIRWDRVIALAAVLGGAGYLAVRAVVGQRAMPSLQPATANPGAAAVPAAQTGVHVAQLSKAEAGALVQQWQQVKQEALGPNHAVARLPSVLSGELLTQWQERAAAVRAHGWHYLHNLESSKVVGVAQERGVPAARVRVVLKEVVQVHRGSEGEPQTFDSQYTVDYDVAYQGGSWLIVGAEVQQ